MPALILGSGKVGAREMLALPLASAILLYCVASAGNAKVTARSPASGAAYLEELVHAAHSRGLSRDPMWLRLGHYRRTVLGGLRSEVDGEGFFLAEQGKRDPEAELEATLRALVAPAADRAGLDHPFCRFPARRLWLTFELSIDWRRLPTRDCPKFAEFLRLLRPEGITLVFSSYYLNNPASAFGHTFLRIHRAREPGRSQQDLLDHGVDYSARVDTNNPVLYAFKGIFGLFPGIFRKLPYYYKVREYNDYESRDIWEYRLKLSQQGIAMVVAHIWEMGSTHLDYYYLGENCSYHILAVLEVADEQLELLGHISWPVLPVDTIKALYRNPGLVEEVGFRPSNRSLFERRARSLTSEQRRWVIALAQEPSAPLPAAMPVIEQAKVLDGAMDLLDYRNARELLRDDERNSEVGRRMQVLLERRASLLLVVEESEVEKPLFELPHVGHGSRRLGLGSGWSSGDGYMHTLSMRLALHDLGDPPRGYPETAEIEFLPTSFRYPVRRSRPKLQDFSLVRVTSLNPISSFESRLSWSVRVGAERLEDPACTDCLAGTGELGVGYAVGLAERALMLWLMPHAQLWVPADGSVMGAVRPGMGGVFGLRLRFAPDLVGLGGLKWHYLVASESRDVLDAKAQLRWQYAPGFALQATYVEYRWGRDLFGVSLIYF